MSNNPPDVLLSLTDGQYTYLCALMEKAKAQAKATFDETASMSSSDERSRHRASLTTAASIDVDMCESICTALMKVENKS